MPVAGSIVGIVVKAVLKKVYGFFKLVVAFAGGAAWQRKRDKKKLQEQVDDAELFREEAEDAPEDETDDFLTGRSDDTK